MQYLKEFPNGNRVAVSHEQWSIDRHDKHYHQILATKGLTIYKLAVPEKGPAMPKLHYGGRVNNRNPNGWRGC